MSVTSTVQPLHDLGGRIALVTRGSRGRGLNADGMEAHNASKHLTGPLLAVNGGASAMVGRTA